MNITTYGMIINELVPLIFYSTITGYLLALGIGCVFSETLPFSKKRVVGAALIIAAILFLRKYYW